MVLCRVTFVNRRYNLPREINRKVIVLESGGTERSLIQTALNKARHQMIVAEKSEDVTRLIRSGQGRVVIADETSLEASIPDFIKTVRAPDLPAAYLLMLISGERDLIDSDDILRKPFSAADLEARITVAERFLSLGDRISKLSQEMEMLALYDKQTGLLNQAAFIKTAHGELERARRASAPLSVIALELDDFPSPTLGDEVLEPVASIIREKSRPYDCIGRWEGGQFMIALPNVIGEDARKIAVRIIKGIRSEPLQIGDHPRTVTAHAAAAAVLRITASTEVEQLIEQARGSILRDTAPTEDDVVLTHS